MSDKGMRGQVRKYFLSEENKTKCRCCGYAQAWGE